MWTNYEVTWSFTRKLCGNVPMNEDLIKPWLDARKPKARAPGGKSIQEVTEEVAATIATTDQDEENKEKEKQITIGFPCLFHFPLFHIVHPRF